jgi:DNA-binding NtrC family response regulator
MIKNKVVICTSNEDIHAYYRTLLNENGVKTLFISKTSELQSVESSSKIIGFIIDLDGVQGHLQELLAWKNFNPFQGKIIVIVPYSASDTEVIELNERGIEVISSTTEKDTILQLIGVTGSKLSHAESIHQKAIEGLLGSKSHSMQKVLNLLQKIKATNASVLLFGDTGTGKEIIARRIHQQSKRLGKFIAINCPAIPTGLAESELFGHEKGAYTGAVNKRIGKILLADRGTVFLDEVGDLALEVQAKLLRILQERELEPLGGIVSTPVDIRLIAATSRDLKKLILEGKFREDLYYRLCDLEIRIPSLKERLEDLPDLIAFFANEFAVETNTEIVKFSEDHISRFRQHFWPGNIRELRGVVRRIIMMSTSVEADSAVVDGEFLYKAGANQPQHVQVGPMLNQSFSIEQSEKTLILQALESQGRNVSKAAKILGMGRTTIYRKMKKYDIAS